MRPLLSGKGFLPDGKMHEVENSKDGYLQKNVVPGCGAGVVQDAAGYRALHGESVVCCTQNQIYSVDDDDVGIHEQETGNDIAHAGLHFQ